MSDVVFPTSNVIFGVFENKESICVLRHLQGRMAYAQYATV